MDWKLLINLLRYAVLAGMMWVAYRTAKRRHLAEAIAGHDDGDSHGAERQPRNHHPEWSR